MASGSRMNGLHRRMTMPFNLQMRRNILIRRGRTDIVDNEDEYVSLQSSLLTLCLLLCSSLRHTSVSQSTLNINHTHTHTHSPPDRLYLNSHQSKHRKGNQVHLLWAEFSSYLPSQINYCSLYWSNSYVHFWFKGLFHNVSLLFIWQVEINCGHSF